MSFLPELAVTSCNQDSKMVGDRCGSRSRGNLTGPGVSSVEHAWRTASSVLGGRHIVVGLTAVAEADADGRGLLLTWHRRGARIIARSMDARTLAESILGVSVRMPPAKSGARQRFSDFLRRLLPPPRGHMGNQPSGRADGDSRQDRPRGPTKKPPGFPSGRFFGGNRQDRLPHLLVCPPGFGGFTPGLTRATAALSRHGRHASG